MAAEGRKPLTPLLPCGDEWMRKKGEGTMPRCEHELVQIDRQYYHGEPVQQCRHCGRYGTISRGYSRGGGHRVIIYKFRDLDAYIAQQKQDTIGAMKRRAEHAESVVFEVGQRDGRWGVKCGSMFVACGSQELAGRMAEQERLDMAASAAKEWSEYYAAIEG